MKSYIRILACASALAPISAHAQFGGVVFDPTQSVHAAQQILQSSQLYTTTVDATRNVISAYNLAQRMATAPQQLYTGFYNLGHQNWTALTQAGTPMATRELGWVQCPRAMALSPARNRRA